MTVFSRLRLFYLPGVLSITFILSWTSFYTAAIAQEVNVPLCFMQTSSGAFIDLSKSMCGANREQSVSYVTNSSNYKGTHSLTVSSEEILSRNFGSTLNTSSRCNASEDLFFRSCLRAIKLNQETRK